MEPAQYPDPAENCPDSGVYFVYYSAWELHNLAAAAIFGLAAATDWVDGYVARKYNLITAFGAFLDPVADKLIVVAAMVMLLEVHATPGLPCPLL